LLPNENFLTVNHLLASQGDVFLLFSLFILFVLILALILVSYEMANKVQTPLVYGEVAISLTNRRLIISKTSRGELVTLQKETVSELWTSAYQICHKVSHGNFFFSVSLLFLFPCFICLLLFFFCEKKRKKQVVCSNSNNSFLYLFVHRFHCKTFQEFLLLTQQKPQLAKM
jgi:hypothetical protein